jgi:plasmid segregation protein ParM
MKNCIGLDVGRSSVKVTAASPDGQRAQLDFPSAFCKSFRMTDASAQARAELETVQVKGSSFFVGQTAIIQGRDDMIGGLTDDWASQPEHVALLLSSLKRLAAAGMTNLEQSLIVVGLPARLYSSQRKIYQNLIGEFLPNAEIKVVPQSMGPYYTMLFDEMGVPQPGFDDSSWAFVEVGQFTTDFALVDRGHVVDRGFDSCDGMRIAAEQLQRILMDDLKIKVTLAEATDLLANPSLRSFGRQIDVSIQVRQASEILAQTIANKASQLFGESVRSLSGIRVAGGGAPLVLEAIAKWTESASGGTVPAEFVSVVPNARFAVAEGFLRFALGLELKRAQVAAV